jgi:hypothetical protein
VRFAWGHQRYAKCRLIRNSDSAVLLFIFRFEEDIGLVARPQSGFSVRLHDTWSRVFPSSKSLVCFCFGDGVPDVSTVNTDLRNKRLTLNVFAVETGSVSILYQ